MTAWPVLAQDAAAPADDATTETPPADETPAEALPDLEMGTPVEDGPQIGQPYVREAFGDWAMRCLRVEEGQPEPCELYQLLLDADGNAVAEFSMVPLPEGGQAVAGATIVAPLETLLTEQLVIAVDGGAGRRYPFSFCNRAGCVARVGFTAEEVQQFKNGNAATLRIVPAVAPDDEVLLTISLTGFTAGFDQGLSAPAE
jgi:invasion protein IalB